MAVAGRRRVKFNLVDKIEHLSDERVVAVKYVSLAEEYLADHFPTFPVLPGVMMLEAITQAAAWLLHRRTGFACSMAVLKEARNVKYGSSSPRAGTAGRGRAASSHRRRGTSRPPARSGDAVAVQRGSNWPISTWPTSSPDLADLDRH